MSDQEIIEMLKKHGIADADKLSSSQLRSFRSMTMGAAGDLLAKKIKDWRKTLYSSAQARAKRGAQ